MDTVVKHGSHDQSAHGRKGGTGRAEPVRSMSEMPPNIRRVAESFDAPTWSRFRDSCDRGGGCEDVAAAIEERFGVPQVTGTFTTKSGAKEYHSWNQDASGWIVDGGQDVFPSGQGDGSALMFFAPGASQYAVDSVAKHGSHNQASHNPNKGGASDDLPEGWSRQSRESVVARFEKQALEEQGQTPEKAREFGERKADLNDYYDGPNGSVVSFEKAHNIPEASRDRLLKQVDEMQQVAPVPGMEVTVGTNAYRYYGEDPRSVGGFAMLGEPKVFLAPRSVTTGFKNDPDWLMPSIKGNTKTYPLAHEWGHTIDGRSRGNAYDDWMAVSKLSGMSAYGRSDSRESFAEAFVDWHLTGGKTTSEAVGYYRDKYNWGSEGGVTMAKAAQATVTIVADTFGPEGATVRKMTPPDPVEWELAQPMAKAVYVAFESGLRPVLKHGSHDQSSHGRRGGGGSSLTLDAGVAQSIVERVRANGGLSVSMVDGSEPTEGFMVAKGGKQSAIVDADEFYDPVKGPEAMSSFLKGNRELSEGAYLGLWHNQADGKVYLDVSENIMDRATAIAAGRERDQISIWDVANFEEIDTGGTGQVGKAVAGSETAGPVEDDRRGDRRVRKESVGEGGGAVVVAFEPGLRPVLKHGSHDQSSHGRRGGGSSAADELRSVPGQYTPPGGGTFTSNADTDEPSSRRSGGKTWQEQYEDQREAIAQALVTGDYSGLNLPDSPLARHLGSAMGRVEQRIARIAERVGIKRKKRYQFTDEQATRMRDSYYERYGKPSWMGKAFKIVRKHLGGAHDQKSHGRGGGGQSGWGERQKEIDAMASAGPSRYALETAASGGMSDDEVRERIAEDFSESIEEQARETVQESMDDEGWVDVTTLDESDPRYDPDGPLMGPTYQEEFDSRMAQAREDITESYVYDYGDEYRNQAQADAGIDPDTFNEVYGTTHTGITPDGREVTLQAQVENVYVNRWDESIDVDGTIYDADGNWAGEFQRKFFRDDSGDMVVEHALLRIEDDYQGTGFSKVFNRTAENYYISHGVNKVDIHAALDVGGYAWAKQGFDWAPKGGATSNVKRQFDDVLRDPSLPASVFNKGTSLRARLDLPASDPDYPTPREVASWGYVQGASTWPGKQTLLGSDWYGQKSLTPSGPRQSTTQQEAAAAVAEVPGQMTLPGVVS